MKKRFFVWLFLLVVVCSVFIFSFSAAADIEPQSVELSLEQTFALYGDHFDGLGYTTSNGVSRVPFYYVCRSSELRNLDHLTFWNYYDSGDAVDQLVYAFNEQDFLIYACDASLVNNDASHLFTVQLPFSIDISNLQFFRQRFWYSINLDGSRAIYASTLDSHRSKVELYSSVSAAAFSQSTLSFGGLREPNNSTSLVGFPLMYTNLRSDGSQYMLGSVLDLYYHPFVDNEPVNFDISGMNLYFKNIARYTMPGSLSQMFGVEYTGTNSYLNALFNKQCFFIFIAPPIISDGFVLPDFGGSGSGTPDYSEQIDNINTNTANISANLAAILAKLDLIYQRMGQSITGTVNISTSSIDAIVDGIKGLFVPSQADILNFRLSMQTMCNNSLAPFFDIEQLRDDAIDSILAAPVVNYVDLPLIDLTDSGIPFELTASQFPGYDVVDDAVRVPLRLGSEWDFFYDLVAWGFDVIATLAFVNMVITKLHALFTGEKVVEVDDN